MKKLFTFLLAAFGLLLQSNLYAQNSPGGQNMAKLAEMLPGTWDWTESRFASRGVKPTLKTPETENTHVSITFRPDNIASVYVNKKLSGMYQYTLSQPTDYVMIKFKANEGQPMPDFLQEGPLTISDNELLISGGYNDAGLNVKFRKAGTKPTPPAPAEVSEPVKTPVATPAKKPTTTTKKQASSSNKKKTTSTKTTK